MILTRNRETIEKLAVHVERLRQTWPRFEDDDGHWPGTLGMPMDVYGGSEIQPWTDDYANLFSILK